MVLFLQMELPSVPVFLSVNGLYDVEYRIVTSCRNGCVYTLKRYSVGTLWCFSMLKCLYDVEYRIVTSCRNGCVYTLKRYSVGTLWCLSMLKCLC